METLVNGVIILFFGFLSFLMWRSTREKIFWLALVFKLLCGILVGLLYRYYYSSGDTWTFYNEGTILADFLRANPDKLIDFLWGDEITFLNIDSIDNRPRSLYFLKWVTLSNLITDSNYWMMSVIFSSLSFCGSWYFFQVLGKHFSSLKREAAISILFIPSIVFWGSGMIKESLAIGFLLLLTGIFVDWYFNRKLSLLQFVCLLISFWVLWSLKYYWLAMWLSVTLPIVLVNLLQTRIAWVGGNPRWGWFILLVISIVSVSTIHPNFYFSRIFDVIAENHDAYVALSNAGDFIQFYDLKSTGWSILINSPWALVSGLFRPFFFEAQNVLQVPASAENFVLLVLFGMTLFRFRKICGQLNLLHMALIAYIIFLSVFLALSTPNFGTLSRFRIGFTPFLWFGLLSGSGVLKRFRKPLSS